MHIFQSNTLHSCLCKWITNCFYYSHNAAISLGRSAPNRPKRWLLASRSKGEWLRMELKVNGYIALGKPVMWRTWCSLLVAIVKSAAGWFGWIFPECLVVFSSCVVFVRGLRWVWSGLLPCSRAQLLAAPPSGCREVRGMLTSWGRETRSHVTKTWPGPDSVEKEGREGRKVRYWN